jgi:hypothetical protein
MHELIMRRDKAAPQRLEPVDEMSAEELACVPFGVDMLVTLKVPRNVRQHRLAWALAQKLSEMTDFLPDRETAMTWLKLKAHHATVVTDGKVTAYIPKSIAFHNLSGMAFTRLFNRMVYVVTTEIIPGLSEERLRDELLAMVGPEPAPKLPRRGTEARHKARGAGRVASNEGAADGAPTGSTGRP